MEKNEIYIPEGLACRTEINSLADYYEIGDMTSLEEGIRSGGYMAMNISSEVISDMVAREDLHPSHRGYFESVVPGPVIIICKELAERLTPAQQAAILWHEDFHIRVKDFDIPRGEGQGYVDCREAEIAADLYAASMTSRETMRSALIETLKNVSKTLSRFNGQSSEEILNTMMNDSTMMARLEALS